MRIGLTAQGATIDKLVAHAQRAEAEGFTSVWFSGRMGGGDPLVAIALAGRATSSIELGTAVLQTYPCHPLLQANRAASVAYAMDRPGLTLGVGPSHRAVIDDVFGYSYEHPGRNTEEYIAILTALLRGEAVHFEGEEWIARTMEGAPTAHPVSVVVAALSPRLLRLAGATAAGTILWLTSSRVIESRVAPEIHAAAAAAGRSAPRIIAGLPVAVHDDEAEARNAFLEGNRIYHQLPIYRRVLAAGGHNTVADVAIVGDEKAVAAQVQSVIDAGATEFWAGIFTVGDKRDSLRRTTELLRSLLD